jgi:S1-C subfamily serine protease
MSEIDPPTVPADADRGPGGGRSSRPQRPPRPGRSAIPVVVGLAFATVALLVAVHGVHITGASAAREAAMSGSGSTAGSAFSVVQAARPAPHAATSAISARVDPALVNIAVTNPSTGLQGEATGMVLTRSGVVLTNNHVIQGATRIAATDIGNGRTYSATVVGYDRSGDVAVIQLRGASGLQTVPLGTSASVTVSDRVLALGNAGGGGGTPRVAQGKVTALGRTITATDIGGGNAERLGGLIETDAAVLPGDSGGPMVNDGGQVVGMDAAASAANVSYTAQRAKVQGFAIPIDEALAIARQIEAGMSSATVHVGPTGFLGVEVVPSPQMAGGFGNAAGPQPQGAFIGGALKGYPAAQLGLKQGDVITAVGGQPVTSATRLTDLLSAHHPGDTVQIDWTDAAGQSHTGTVRLASGPAA